MTKLTDMGTTSLIDYVLTPGFMGRKENGRRQAATNVIRRRYGAEGVRRFNLAICWTRAAHEAQRLKGEARRASRG